MKKINDEKIVNFVKENNNYSIKTTSQNILNQYKYEMNLEAQKAPKKSHKKAITIGSICGTLGLASAALIAVIVVGVTPNDSNKPYDSNTLLPVVDPTTNEGLKKQLITFSAFTPTENSNKLELHNLLRASVLNQTKESKDVEDDDENDDEKDDDSEKESVITKSIVEETVNKYEGVEQSVKYLYKGSDVKVKNLEVDKTFDKVNYKFVTEFRIGENSEPFAYYYFNEYATKNSSSDYEFKTKAYYKTLDKEFNVDVEESKETSDDESEAETTLIFRDAKKVDTKIYLIAKENEVETENGQTSSENEFKIETYLNEDSFKKEDYLKKVSAETEVEDKESEISVKIKDSKSEVKYKISKLDKFNFKLTISYEKIETEEEYEGIEICLNYSDKGRTYTWNNSEKWLFPNLKGE